MFDVNMKRRANLEAKGGGLLILLRVLHNQHHQSTHNITAHCGLTDNVNKSVTIVSTVFYAVDTRASDLVISTMCVLIDLHVTHTSP